MASRSRSVLLDVAGAASALRAIAEHGLRTTSTGGRGPLALYVRADWDRYRTLLARLPEGIDPQLVAGVLHLEAYELAHLGTLAPHLDDAVIAFLEEQARADALWRPDCAFVIGALDAGRGERHGRLQQLIGMIPSLPPAAGCRPGQHARLVAERPDVVAGAQAAVAVTAVPSRPGVSHFERSRYVPVLAADASRESLDLLLPFVEVARREPDARLDWFRQAVVPLFGATPHARAITELLSGVATERTASSPARAFAESLGMVPAPPTLQFTLTFRGRAGKTARSRALPAFQLRIDSTQAAWLTGRRSGAWVPYELDRDMLVQQFSVPATEYTLRIESAGADRAKIEAWAASFLDRTSRS